MNITSLELCPGSCNKVCLDLNAGASIGNVTVKGKPYSSYHSQVALWYCEDHKQHYIYDWHAQKYLKVSKIFIEKV